MRARAGGRGANSYPGTFFFPGGRGPEFLYQFFKLIKSIEQLIKSMEQQSKISRKKNFIFLICLENIVKHKENLRVSWEMK